MSRSALSKAITAVRISKDNISKTPNSRHGECDLEITCLPLITAECSAIFAVLKHMRTLLRLQGESIQCIKHLSNLPVECTHEISMCITYNEFYIKRRALFPYF